MRHLKKHLIATAVMTSLLFTAGCNEQQVAEETVVPVDVYKIQFVDIPIVVKLSGRAVAYKESDIRPQVSGIIKQRMFTEGQIVTEGTQLYQIDDSPYIDQVHIAEAKYNQAKASYDSASKLFSRVSELFKTKAISAQDYDNSKGKYEIAKAQIDSAKAELEKAKLNLEYAKVYAPITGIISRSKLTEGALVSQEQAEPLATISMIDPIYVDLSQVAEQSIRIDYFTKLGYINPGDTISVKLFNSKGEPYSVEGSLNFAEKTVGSSGLVNLRATVNNPSYELMPGLYVKGEVNFGTVPNIAIIDTMGIVREAQGKTYIYVIGKDNTVEKKEVETYFHYDRDHYAVSGDLKEGEKVIITNHQKIGVGSKVMDAADLPPMIPADENKQDKE